MAEMEEKSRILIIGATGNLGFHLAHASLRFSHLTFALVRDSAFFQPDKLSKIQSLSGAGVTILKGSLEEEEKLLEALKQVDVVICAVSSKQVLDQKLLIQAIKKAGCIKRFIPAEFGADADKVQISVMDYGFYSRKVEIRRIIEAEEIPHTYVSSNFYMSYLLPSLVQPDLMAPPREKVNIFGDGDVKGIFVKESDVAAFTISTVDDSRSLNKVLYLRPKGNICSMNELVHMWEGKIGRQLDKLYISEETLLSKIKGPFGGVTLGWKPGVPPLTRAIYEQETPYPDNMPMIFIYSVFIKGDHTYFDIESAGGLEGTQLYPHLKYTTISQYLDTLV